MPTLFGSGEQIRGAAEGLAIVGVVWRKEKMFTGADFHCRCPAAFEKHENTIADAC